MSGTTPGGWPYVTPDDHPKTYPAWSQQFATALDAEKLKTTKAVWTPSSGWADKGGAAAGLYVTRVGGIVTIEGTLNRTGGNLSVTSLFGVQIGTLPAGFYPAHTVDQVVFCGSSVGANLAYVELNTSGVVGLVPMFNGTIRTNDTTNFAFAYRGA